MIQPVTKTFGKNKDTLGVVGRAPQRPKHSLGQSLKVLGETLLRLAIGPKRLGVSRLDCTPRSARRPSIRHSLFPAEGGYPQSHMVDQQRLQISELHFDKFPKLSTFFMLEDKIQNPRKCLFQFTFGANVMDQRSGDGRFSGRCYIVALKSRAYSFPAF